MVRDSVSTEIVSLSTITTILDSQMRTVLSVSTNGSSQARKGRPRTKKGHLLDEYTPHVRPVFNTGTFSFLIFFKVYFSIQEMVTSRRNIRYPF